MSFGVTTDKFGIADTNWKPLNLSSEPISSQANAQDSFGDNVCESVFDTAYSYSQEYQYCGAGDTLGNIVFPTLVIGNDTTNAVLVTGVTLATSNTERPRMTLAGEDAFGTSTNQYTLTMPTVSGSKKAQALGFVADTTTVTRVNSSTWAATAQTSYVQDSDGQRVLADVYGARIEASGELVSCTGIATAAADTANGYALSGPVAKSQENTGYGSSTVNVFKNLTADV